MERSKKRIIASIVFQLLLSELQFQATGSPLVENRICNKGNCFEKGMNQKGYKVCNTTGCYQTAESYKQLLNFSAAPCDDFYAFTCGHNSTGTLLTLMQNLPKAIEELLLTPEIDTPKGHYENVKSIYQGCLVAAHAHREDLVKAVKTALRNTGGMPLISDTDYEPGLSWERRFGIFLRQSKSNPLFGFEVSDQDNLLAVISHFPKSLLPSTLKLLFLWKTVMKHKICFVRGENQNCTEDQELDDELSTIIEFELNLMENAASPLSMDFIHYPDKYIMTMKEVTETFSKFNWMDFFEELFRETELSISEKTKFLVSNKNAIKKMLSFIASTENKTIDIYLGLFTIDMVGIGHTHVFREYIRSNEDLKELLEDNFEERVLFTCNEEIQYIFPYSVSRIYAEKYFGLENRKDVIKMIYNLKQEMGNFLLEKDWMDNETKREAANKAIRMESYVGYPPWIFDDHEIQRREAMPETFAKKSFHSTLTEAYHYKKCKSLRNFAASNGTNKIIKVITKDTEFWKGGPISFQLQYVGEANLLQIAAGALRPPLYNRDTLPSLNYGSLGFALGHEVTHAFDIVGIKFDAFGKKTDWFSKASEEYEKRIQCYRDLFSSIVDDLTKLKLDGNKTLAENMADLGGLRRAYYAYVKLNADDVRLPGLESITHKQLFFIAGAKMFCEKDNFADRRDSVLRDVHSPGKHRVLLTLKNFPPFAEAFNCPKGSPMNPEKRCPMSK